MCKPRFCSQGVILDGFETKKVKEKKTLKALETPPLMAKVMKNYHFNTSLFQHMARKRKRQLYKELRIRTLGAKSQSTSCPLGSSFCLSVKRPRKHNIVTPSSSPPSSSLSHCNIVTLCYCIILTL